MSGRTLVGRQRELSARVAALDAAARGARMVLLFSGEPGIGKTRLLEELATRALARGALVAWGRMWEVGLTPSYWPWLQVLGSLETPQDPAPALGTLDAASSAGTRLARFGEVRAFLLRRAAIAPLALLLDDVHAADLASLELLEYLLAELVGSRVLLALAARDRDCDRETAARLGRIQRAAERHPLGPLDAGEVAALVGDRAPAGKVFELSEGNPLFVEELVASHLARGPLGLPRLSSVRALIFERVSRLPLDTRRALDAGAVLGREFRGRVVTEMVPVTDVAQALVAALDLGVVAVAGPDRFRFSHALVAEALADALDPAARARLHLLAAQAIERVTPGESGALAHHLLAAGELCAAAAVDAAALAAREAMARLAFEDAAALLERALRALELSPPVDGLRRAQLLCQRAEALQHAARHAQAAEACQAALDLVRSLAVDAASSGGDSPGELFARIALARGLVLQPGLIDPLLVALLSEALERLGPEPVALRAKLLARLAAAQQPAVDPSVPVARALEAIDLAAGLAPGDRLNVLYVASAALVEYVDAEWLTRLHREVLELARGDRWIVTHTRLRLCFAALDRADRAGFDAERAAFEAEVTALGLPQWQRHVHALRSLTALLDGEFARADAEAAQSNTISVALGDAGALWRADVHRAMASWTRTAPIDPDLQARITPGVPRRAAVAAWFAAQAGDAVAARAALAELGPDVPTDPDFAMMMGYAVAFVGDAAQAARLYDVLLARRSRPVLASMVGWAVFDLQDRVQLLLAAAAARSDRIDTHAAAALALADRLGSPVWAARVRADWADALERTGAQVERVHELRAQALAAAQRFQMPGLVARCRAGELASSEALVAAPPASVQHDGVRLTRRGALWLVSGFGEEAPVKDSRGMQMLTRLVAEPGRALHALELGAAPGGPDPGDLGPALDHSARNRYRTRLAELALERDAAESTADRGRLERIDAELQAIDAELERAFGLGGRARPIGAASERARSNVQRRISHALAAIREVSPRLGEHLAASVRTGVYCIYEPRGHNRGLER